MAGTFSSVRTPRWPIRIRSSAEMPAVILHHDAQALTVSRNCHQTEAVNARHATAHLHALSRTFPSNSVKSPRSPMN